MNQTIRFECFGGKGFAEHTFPDDIKIRGFDLTRYISDQILLIYVERHDHLYLLEYADGFFREAVPFEKNSPPY